jgi:hypothetical protein
MKDKGRCMGALRGGQPGAGNSVQVQRERPPRLRVVFDLQQQREDALIGHGIAVRAIDLVKTVVSR